MMINKFLNYLKKYVNKYKNFNNAFLSLYQINYQYYILLSLYFGNNY